MLPYIRENLYLSSWYWLISLGILISNWGHFDADGRASLSYWQVTVPWSGCTTVSFQQASKLFPCLYSLLLLMKMP